MGKEDRGFASMDHDKVRRIASRVIDCAENIDKEKSVVPLITAVCAATTA